MAKTQAERQADYRARQAEQMTKTTLDAYYIGRSDYREGRGFRSLQSLRDAISGLDSVADTEINAMLDRTFSAGGTSVLLPPTPAAPK
ncbi:MAG TPA: hypothetical protein VLC08_16380 [Chitinolyticbacter sp.]|nr:hypothetical protein [Chitinolyticbacter sp.]